MADTTPSLHEFVREFFEFFEARVQRLDRKKQGALAVTLPPELADYFGTPELKLTFQHAQASDFELVAHGSRIFDRMLAYLERRGALTVQHLPARHTSSDELLRALRPMNAGIANLQLQEQTQPLFIFNWRITYRADDKREELYTVVLDEAGERVPLAEEAGGSVRRGRAPIDLESLLADGTPPVPERDAEGQLVPPRLVPLAQLVRLAETARKYATYHADLRCVSHEGDILPRLYQTLNRLTTYYEQQIQEVYDTHDPTGEKRQALELDLARKIAEEVENHRLRVQVNLFSYAIVQMPVALANIELSDGQRRAAVQVRRNRYTGELETPPCHVCQMPLTQVTLDRSGHVVCEECVAVCKGCGDLLCDECGVAACPVCGQENCDQCSTACWACGQAACREHVSRCPVCEDDVCHACQTACAACGTRQCRSHLRADAVAAAAGEDALICGECAVRCPGCQQYSAQVGVCSASGQRFCASCLVVCVECGDQFGSGFYRVHPATGEAYCERCLKECPACGALTPEVMACPVCGETCCFGCGRVCAICEQPHCAAHAYSYPDCGHVVCTSHKAVCELCDAAAVTTPVCPVCDDRACPTCDKAVCEAHMRACVRCGVPYCAECVSSEQTCPTCTTIQRDGRAVHMEDEPCAADARVRNLPGAYNWVRAENARYHIYRGTATFMPEVTVAVERKTRTVKTVRKTSLLDTLRNRFGLSS